MAERERFLRAGLVTPLPGGPGIVPAGMRTGAQGALLKRERRRGYPRGNWPGLLAHFAVPIRAPNHVPKIMENGLPRPNTQTMTFVVGRLFVHVRSSATDVFENWRLAQPDLLAQIWPIRRNIVGWPLDRLTDRNADGIASSFHLASDTVAKNMIEQSTL